MHVTGNGFMFGLQFENCYISKDKLSVGNFCNSILGSFFFDGKVVME